MLFLMVLAVSKLFYQKIINFQIFDLDVEIYPVLVSRLCRWVCQKRLGGKERNAKLLWFGTVTVLCTWLEVHKENCFHD